MQNHSKKKNMQRQKILSSLKLLLSLNSISTYRQKSTKRRGKRSFALLKKVVLPLKCQILKCGRRSVRKRGLEGREKRKWEK